MGTAAVTGGARLAGDSSAPRALVGVLDGDGDGGCVGNTPGTASGGSVGLNVETVGDGVGAAVSEVPDGGEVGATVVSFIEESPGVGINVGAVVVPLEALGDVVGVSVVALLALSGTEVELLSPGDNVGASVLQELGGFAERRQIPSFM